MGICEYSLDITRLEQESGKGSKLFVLRLYDLDVFGWRQGKLSDDAEPRWKLD